MTLITNLKSSYDINDYPEIKSGLKGLSRNQVRTKITGVKVNFYDTQFVLLQRKMGICCTCNIAQSLVVILNQILANDKFNRKVREKQKSRMHLTIFSIYSGQCNRLITYRKLDVVRSSFFLTFSFKITIFEAEAQRSLAHVNQRSLRGTLWASAVLS